MAEIPLVQPCQRTKQDLWDGGRDVVITESVIRECWQLFDGEGWTSFSLLYCQFDLFYSAKIFSAFSSSPSSWNQVIMALGKTWSECTLTTQTNRKIKKNPHQLLISLILFFPLLRLTEGLGWQNGSALDHFKHPSPRFAGKCPPTRKLGEAWLKSKKAMLNLEAWGSSPHPPVT